MCFFVIDQEMKSQISEKCLEIVIKNEVYMEYIFQKILLGAYSKDVSYYLLKKYFTAITFDKFLSHGPAVSFFGNMGIGQKEISNLRDIMKDKILKFFEESEKYEILSEFKNLCLFL